jgi:hypothetical protein
MEKRKIRKREKGSDKESEKRIPDSTHGTLSENFTIKDKSGQSNWYNSNKKERSTLFPAIANAMAEQYGNFLLTQNKQHA